MQKDETIIMIELYKKQFFFLNSQFININEWHNHYHHY